MNRTVATSLALAVAALTSPSAFAQDARGFGAQGQIAISSDIELTIRSHTEKHPDGTSSSSSAVVLRPALDYFLATNLSLGGYVEIATGSGGWSRFAVAPRIGYDIPIGEVLSFWPKAGIGFGTESDGDRSGSRFFVHAFAPLLVHPAPHFFLGLGPGFEMDLMRKVGGEDASKGTDFGVSSVVGGWF